MKTNTESLGDRIKSYESNYETSVLPTEELIVRIDGHHFSAFTKNFEKPFDSLFREAMARTAEDLMQRFCAYSVYTQSDEFTIYIPSFQDGSKERENWTHTFSGRTHKISSLVAAFTTMSFNKHLRILVNLIPEKYSEIVYKILDCAYFDARTFGVPSKEEVFNCFMFRSRDNEKNSKSQFAQAYCSHKELLNKNGEEQIEYCYSKYGFNWNTIEDKYKYGVLIKKEIYQKETDTGFVDRSRCTRIYKSFTSFSEENVNLICSQYLL